MKLAYLLAQYLYTNKRLDLPGIGTFKLDPAVLVEQENPKQRSAISDGISFESNHSIQNAPDLIEYISSKTGKMKSLAESDLESHIQLVQQFLNISKPFQFEGIGTLVKVKSGEYEFTPGTLIPEKLRENPDKDRQSVAHKETVEGKYQAFLATPSRQPRWKKPVVLLLIVCGAGLAVLGGYLISTRQSDKTESVATPTTAIVTEPEPDSAQIRQHIADSLRQVAAQAPSTYKYVLEITGAKRAFTRFNQLKTNLWDVKLETRDSVKYKLFLILPVTSDTTWKMDSLTALSGKKVYIEHQN